jgi:hypothetical protein
MAINPAPLGSPIVGVHPVSSPWMTWFQLLFGTVFGWRETLKITVLDVDFGSSIAAHSVGFDTKSNIQEARYGDIVAWSLDGITGNAVLPDGLIPEVAVTADNTIFFRATNVTASSIDPLSPYTFQLILFRQ